MLDFVAAAFDPFVWAPAAILGAFSRLQRFWAVGFCVAGAASMFTYAVSGEAPALTAVVGRFVSASVLFWLGSCFRKGKADITTSGVSGKKNVSPQPDMDFASQGFSAIALMRANDADVDLHDAEQKIGLGMLDAGCSEQQAYSARWGGVQAIEANLSLYSAAVDAAVETIRSYGMIDLDDPKMKFRMAARLYLSQILAEAPSDYERFLTHIGRSKTVANQGADKTALSLPDPELRRRKQELQAKIASMQK